MKKTLFILTLLALGLGVTAQTNSRHIKNLEQLRQRSEMKKESQLRQQKPLNLQELNLRSDAAVAMPATQAKSKSAKQWSTDMPADRWFPGEWEEVQAIVVTFPYNAYPAGHVGDDDYTADIYLPGMGTNGTTTPTAGSISTVAGALWMARPTPPTMRHTSPISPN